MNIVRITNAGGQQVPFDLDGGDPVPDGFSVMGPWASTGGPQGGPVSDNFHTSPPANLQGAQNFLNNANAAVPQTVTATPTTPISGPPSSLPSAGTAGGSGGQGVSTSASNSGFTGLTSSGSNTGASTIGGTVQTPQPPTATNPPATGVTGTPAVGSGQSGFSGLVGTGSGGSVGATGSGVQAIRNVVSNQPPAGAPTATAPTATLGQVTAPPATTGTATLPNTPAPTTNSSAPSQWNAQSYLQSRPDLLNNWNNDPGYAQLYGSLDNYALADAKANGGPKWQPLANSYVPPAGYTPATAPTTGGNYNQSQNASQLGTFNTTGQTNTAQNQVTGQAQNTAQTGTQANSQQGVTNTQGTQAQTGGQTGTQAGNVATTGTQTTAPVDTLGFGQLLKNQAGSVGASDVARQQTLTGLMQAGDPALQSQVDQAVRQSLTGPQVTGAGDSARARMGGYAAAQVGRNSAGTQLAAAQQLGGPTGLETLSSAANPFVGQSSTNTGNQATTGTSSGTNFSNLVNNSSAQNAINSLSSSAGNTASNTAGFSNLLGTETQGQQGTATGLSSQAAAGQIPSAQTVSTGGGGCVLCTAGVELGIWNNLRVLRKVIDYKLRTKAFTSAARGYFFLFTPLARWLLARPRLATSLVPMARAVVYEELRVAGRRLPRKVWPTIIHWTGHALCHVVGKFPVPGRVTDPVIESIARKNNIWFSLS